MKKRRIAVALLLALVCSVQVLAQNGGLVPMGQAVGLDVKCSGLMVVGFAQDSPARDSGLRPGDQIRSVDGFPVSAPEELRALLQEKSQVTLTALREGREQSFLVPLRQSGGVCLLGANVKTEMAGIGTLTYYDPEDGSFGALGHGIADETGLFPAAGGFLCRATILAAEPGLPGRPGMLQGAFQPEEELGRVLRNTDQGIFGTLAPPQEGEPVAVAAWEEIATGPAEVQCNVRGDRVERFQVEIRRLHPVGDGRDLLLKVTDPELLAETGGIVQGMSGSPIIQNGKLIGAVTHVFVNRPDTGYGIYIGNMLEAAA